MTSSSAAPLISFSLLSLALSCHLTCALFAGSTGQATIRQFSDPPSKSSASDERRQALWASLLKSWTPAKGDLKKKIVVYAENPDQSQICFRCQGDPSFLTYIYVLRQKNLILCATSQNEPVINCITFERNSRPFTDSFVLWSNGKRAETIPTLTPRP